MASNTVDNNNLPESNTIITVVPNKSNATLDDKTENVTPEEQDNINNMNANNCVSADTTFFEHILETTINNNLQNEANNTATQHVNNGQCNGQSNMNTVQKKCDSSGTEECDIVEMVSMQNNALSDLMNTYSSDEDMFENFRNKPDNHKSEDEECLSSSTSFLSINESGNSSEDEPIACAPKKSKGVKMKSTRNKGELDLDDLPPIEDLQISVPEEQCLPVGKILNIVDTLVLIKTLKNTPTLDLDSVLFLDKGQRSLGKIFDVIGPVSGPVYCVRFNSHQHIVDSNIKVDQDVYCAPQTEHTSYVPLPDLIKSKGTDASWEKDREPPPEVVEFSDDEEERKVKREILRDRRNNRNNQPPSVPPGAPADPDTEPPSPKSRRPTPFEQRMNLRNLLMTASYERRNRTTGNTSEPSTSSKPMAPPPPASIIRPPTLPDIPPLPLPAQHPLHAVGGMPNTRLPPPPLGVFSPPLFHQGNKKPRPTTVSPFPQHRYPPNPPMFPPFTSLPPPPPLFNDVLLFTPPGPYPYVSTPPPFQFGMPPLVSGRGAARYRHSNPRPPSMMRPAFGSRHRF